MSRYEEFVALRNQGLTYREIAEKAGVSRQYVAHVCHKYSGKLHFRAYKSKECVYDGLRSWLNENYITRNRFACIISNVKVPGGNWYHTARSRLAGRTNFTQREIDRLLDESGMTYEQLFRSGRWCEDGKAKSG